MKNKKGIIQFSDFFKGGEANNSFNKEDFKDFFTENEEEQVFESVDGDQQVNLDSEEPLETIPTDDDFEEEEVVDSDEEEEEFIRHHQETNENFYSIYKDKTEDFSCDIQLEGANLKDTQARLILETKDWNLVFNGEISKNGKCSIPIKKLSILNEGETGKIKLEVIAEGTLFIPWEDEFKVKVSKKVAVKIHESKSNPAKKPQTKTKGVKVKVNR